MGYAHIIDGWLERFASFEVVSELYERFSCQFLELLPVEKELKLKSSNDRPKPIILAHIDLAQVHFVSHDVHAPSFTLSIRPQSKSILIVLQSKNLE